MGKGLYRDTPHHKGSFKTRELKAGCMSCTKKARIVSSIGETHTISIVYGSNILGPFTKQ
jgi:G3E family GTPase